MMTFQSPKQVAGGLPVQQGFHINRVLRQRSERIVRDSEVVQLGIVRISREVGQCLLMTFGGVLARYRTKSGNALIVVRREKALIHSGVDPPGNWFAPPVAIEAAVEATKLLKPSV